MQCLYLQSLIGFWRRIATTLAIWTSLTIVPLYASCTSSKIWSPQMMRDVADSCVTFACFCPLSWATQWIVAQIARYHGDVRLRAERFQNAPSHITLWSFGSSLCCQKCPSCYAFVGLHTVSSHTAPHTAPHTHTHTCTHSHTHTHTHSGTLFPALIRGNYTSEISDNNHLLSSNR